MEIQTAQVVYPVIKQVHEDPNANFTNMVVPFTDGRKAIQVVANLEKSFKSEGQEVMDALERNVTLAMIDQHWKDHLREMDDLRQSVRSAVYEQKDPLLIYKFESFELFKKMVDQIGRDIISFLIKAQLPEAQDSKPVQEAPAQKVDISKLKTQKDELPSEVSGPQYNDPSANQEPEKKEPVRVEKTYGRNDRVEIINLMTGEAKEMKYKQAEPLFQSGQWRIKE